ncbi:hypothetical protein GCM10022381_34450 [Leifsonia kafniensis]|uniref:DUF3048 domain-containing protein n=1 Tax=Leifsonia kafniensis TaxID=475957 RepID=A0ABP7KWA1_9MICO
MHATTPGPRPQRRFAGWGIALLIPVLVLTACTNAAPEPTSTPRPVVPSSTPTPTVVALAPLRGTPQDLGSATSPALSVKIDNHEDARPQIGLERTDIVFEELVEGGLTRYVAVWQSDIPDLVGPVRSIRPMDPDIITPFGGIVAYSGGQEIFIAMMEATPVVNARFDDDETGLFYRIDEKDSPHDVVVEAKELIALHPDLAPPVQQFTYATTPAEAAAVVSGTPTTTINSRFSDARWPSWNWNAASSSYLRSQEGEADLDSNGAQLQATNLLVLRVGIDDTYGDVPKTVMLGSGEAWVSTGGKTVHATWSKDAAGSLIRLVADNGALITLAAGNTWIELVPTDTGSVELVP